MTDPHKHPAAHPEEYAALHALPEYQALTALNQLMADILLGRRLDNPDRVYEPTRPFEPLNDPPADELNRPLLDPIAPEAIVRDVLSGMDSFDLDALVIPPLQQAISGLLPEGLGVIGAPPKAGKSMLAYQMAVALTHGGTLLGIVAERRPVLYYALEDGQRRSQARVQAARGNLAAVPGLYLSWMAPKLGAGLETEVAGWLDGHDRGVVIIDVLAKVRSSGQRGLNAYDEDYSLLTELHTVCRRHPGSTVLLITHDRKAGAEDWMSRITGTRGVVGVADFVIYIHRARTDRVGTVYVTGRDIEDASYPVTFDGTGWQLATPAIVMSTLSASRQAIYAYLEANGPAAPAAIAEAISLPVGVVQQRLINMVRDEQVLRVGYGEYCIPDATD